MDYAHPAVQGVIYCDKLFAIEKYCREHVYTAEQRHAYRLKKAPPVLQVFWKWLESLQDADPKSRLGKAYTYAKNRRPYLETYLEDGRCSLSNNAAENAIRPFWWDAGTGCSAIRRPAHRPVRWFTRWCRWPGRTISTWNGI